MEKEPTKQNVEPKKKPYSKPVLRIIKPELGEFIFSAILDPSSRG